MYDACYRRFLRLNLLDNNCMTTVLVNLLPIWDALLRFFIFKLTQHYNHIYFVFPDHLPKIWYWWTSWCLLTTINSFCHISTEFWWCRCYKCRAHLVTSFHERIDVASIEISTKALVCSVQLHFLKVFFYRVYLFFFIGLLLAKILIWNLINW